MKRTNGWAQMSFYFKFVMGSNLKKPKFIFLTF